MFFRIFVPQPRGPVQTATLPVTMATASRSAGSAMAKRSVLMDLMNRRPLVVSLALDLSFLTCIFMLASCWAHVSRPEDTLCRALWGVGGSW